MTDTHGWGLHTEKGGSDRGLNLSGILKSHSDWQPPLNGLKTNVKILTPSALALETAVRHPEVEGKG